MLKAKTVFAVALSALLLAACGNQGSAAAETNAADAETNAIGNARTADPGQPNGSDQPDADFFPPPDAVSHPNGFLPNASDLPEPATTAPPGSKEPPPATEDEYMRNKQAGR